MIYQILFPIALWIKVKIDHLKRHWSNSLDRGSGIWCRCVKIGIPYMSIPEHYSRLLRGLFLQWFSFRVCPKMDLLSFVKHLIPIPSFSFNRNCSSLVKILSLGQTSSRLSTSCVYTQKMHSFCARRTEFKSFRVYNKLCVSGCCALWWVILCFRRFNTHFRQNHKYSGTMWENNILLMQQFLKIISLASEKIPPKI